eukprot:g2800.t1
MATGGRSAAAAAVVERTRPFLCYLLVSASSRKTYVGVTNDLAHRLRAHNGEISGGAKYTRLGRPWDVFLSVEGFPSKVEAMQFEWKWKNIAPKRQHGERARISKLQSVLHLERWTSKSPEARSVPLTVRAHLDRPSLNEFEDLSTIIRASRE